MADEFIGSGAAIRAVMADKAAGKDPTASLAVFDREIEREEREGSPSASADRTSAEEPSRRQQIAGLTYDELLADRPLLDRVVRAVAIERDLDYLEALEKIQSCNRGSGETLVARTLADAVDLDTVLTDVVAMEERETPADPVDVEMLDTTDPARQVPVSAADEYGRVVLADDADRAHLLTDAYTIERAWLKAKELDARGAGAYRDGGKEARERFEKDYRGAIEDGFDLVASLGAKAEPPSPELSADQLQDIAAADRLEPLEREKRAERHRLEREIAERQERLGRL